MMPIVVAACLPGTAGLLRALAIGLPLQAQSELNQTAEQEITFKTEDGWTIHGVLSLPRAGAEFGRIPAVILLHAPMHDRLTTVQLR